MLEAANVFAIERALSKAPDERYETIGEWVAAPVMFDVEPTVDWLRNDLRFTALLRSIGIPRLRSS